MTRIVRSTPQTRVVNSKIIGSVDVDTARFRFNQTPVETPNGVITIFTLPSSESYVSGLIDVYLDGLKQIKTTDYTESAATTITFVTAPATGEVVRLNYIKQ